MTNKIIFYIYLIVHALVWSCIQLIRNVASVDAIEAVVWGDLLSFGTNKHPPFSGWIMSGVYNLCGQSDFVIYLTGQICIIIGFIFIYKLAKFFMDEEKAFLSVMILEGCFYYSYYIFINSYNCNVVLMALWPIIIYYFYKSVRQNTLKDWLTFGITSGLGFLCKYQVVLLFLALLAYLIIVERNQFKKRGMYLALLAGLAIIAGHIIWLGQTDFFSFSYMLERTGSETHNLPSLLVKISHIFYPIKFIVGQIIAIAGCIGIYLLIALQAKNIKLTDLKENKSDKLFLLFVFWLPVIFQGSMGIITGSRVPSMWGTIMVGLAGVLLFGFFPVEFNKETFKYSVKLSYGAMSISLAVVSIFAVLQTQFVISHPYQKIIPDFQKIWYENTGNPNLKYIGGHFDMVFPFRAYSNTKVVLHTFGHLNPWIDAKELRSTGIIVVAKTPAEVLLLTPLEYFPLDNDMEIQKYSIDVCNKINICDKETFYYTVIKPESN